MTFLTKYAFISSFDAFSKYGISSIVKGISSKGFSSLNIFEFSSEGGPDLNWRYSQLRAKNKYF